MQNPALRYFLALSVLVGMGPTAARTNVGLVDYAYVSPENCSCQMLISSSKYANPKSAKNTVQKDSVYEVSLKKAKMDKFNADLFSASRGEFAIVAKAFEMSSDPTLPTSAFDFRPDSASGGRVIYYSDDVKRHQALNFGMVPMFGPVVYNGNPVGISVFLVEIDTTKDNAQMSALLSTIASAGRLASVPGTPLFNMLESLGTSLINANKDDLLLRYDTTFRSDKGAHPDIKTSLFRYGEYVLIRNENREAPIEWEQYSYDPATGRVYAGEGCSKPYDGAYAVIQINRAHSEAFFKPALLGNMLSEIRKDNQASQQALESFLKSAVSEIQSAKEYRNAINLLDEMQASLDSGKKPSANLLGEFKESLSLFEENAKTIKLAKGPALFSATQFDQIIARLRRLTDDPGISQATFSADGTYKKLVGMLPKAQ